MGQFDVSFTLLLCGGSSRSNGFVMRAMRIDLEHMRLSPMVGRSMIMNAA